MTFTLVSECYAPKAASKKISYLILAFAITPGLSAALGGILNEHFGWMSCFYAGAVYGLILLFLSTRLPETLPEVDHHALKWPHIIASYAVQFKSTRLVAGAMMMGTSTCFVYTVAAVAPFVAIDILGMDSAEYGIANILPSLGLLIGALTSAQLSDYFDSESIILAGLTTAVLGIFGMLSAVWMHASAMNSIFIPMMIIYLGLSAILGNASSIAMRDVEDKAHGSAVMNFINMGFATVVVLILGWLPVSTYLLPCMFILFASSMYCFYRLAKSA